VVPVRNGEATIAACLQALLGQHYPADRYEIVVVDNASTDGTKEIVACYPVSYVYEPNVGRAHARNRGIAESQCEIVAFVDADCIADGEWLRELAAAFEREPVSAVAGEILADRPTRAAQRFMAQREARWQSHVLALDRPFAITANVAFRREVFEHVGPFDPVFVTAEDVDFGWRFFATGFRMSYAPIATVSHQLRRTAWQLFRQQEGLGYGRVLLRERYRLAPDYGSPTREDLQEAAGELLRGVRARSRGADEQTAFAFYELLRLASLRTGALRRELVSHFAPCPAA
jgi:O-antigen biosynthesis protein